MRGVTVTRRAGRSRPTIAVLSGMLASRIGSKMGWFIQVSKPIVAVP